MMQDLTKLNRIRNRERDSECAQIIYMCEAGDYCRTTAPKSISAHEQAATWAVSNFHSIADDHARNTVMGFRVEWF